MLLYSVRYGSASTSMRRAFSPHTPMPLRRCRAPATLRAPDAPLWLVWIAARHAMSMAGTTALQDMMAELDGRRREARSTATRMGDLARARRAAVIAARLMGARERYMCGGLRCCSWERRRCGACALPQQLLLRTADLLILPGCCRGRGNPLPRSPRRLTACVIAGCVGHAPVHSDSDPQGGPCARGVVLNSKSRATEPPRRDAGGLSCIDSEE